MEDQLEKLKERNRDLSYLNTILEKNNQLQKEEIMYLKRCLGIDVNGNDNKNHLTIE